MAKKRRPRKTSGLEYSIFTVVYVVAGAAGADLIGRFAVDIEVFPGVEPIVVRAASWLLVAVAIYAVRSVNRPGRVYQTPPPPERNKRGRR